MNHICGRKIIINRISWYHSYQSIDGGWYQNIMRIRVQTHVNASHTNRCASNPLDHVDFIILSCQHSDRRWAQIEREINIYTISISNIVKLTKQLLKRSTDRHQCVSSVFKYGRGRTRNLWYYYSIAIYDDISNNVLFILFIIIIN